MIAGAGEQTDDAGLAARFRRDPERFVEVHDRYIHDIYRYAAGRLDVQAAEDIAAETFCVAFGRRDRFDPARGGLRPWLFGIATNLVARHRRKEARHYQALARTWAEPTVGSHEDRVVAAVAARRMQPKLARALTKLSQGERDVLLLVALGQLTSRGSTPSRTSIRRPGGVPISSWAASATRSPSSSGCRPIRRN